MIDASRVLLARLISWLQTHLSNGCGGLSEVYTTPELTPCFVETHVGVKWDQVGRRSEDDLVEPDGLDQVLRRRQLSSHGMHNFCVAMS